jgi:hypothetical protein
MSARRSRGESERLARIGLAEGHPADQFEGIMGAHATLDHAALGRRLADRTAAHRLVASLGLASGHRGLGFQVDNPWYAGVADLLTYEPEELLGSKLRTLYQRKKGRDLFDLSETLVRLPALDVEKVVACFRRCLERDGLGITRKEFERNLAEKIEDKAFLGDLAPLLTLGLSFDAAVARERVQDAFITRLP